jgi:hypothetical protein
MKQLLSTIFIALNFGVIFGQNLNNMGKDYNPILNKTESDYFNVFFKDKRQEFDFKNKKVAFISYKYDYIFIRSKNDFFNFYYKEKPTANERRIKMIILDSMKRQATNGIDVVLIMDTSKKAISKELFSRIIEKLDSCENLKPSYLYQLGLDSNPILTVFESDYFNKSNKENYDFTNAKLGFFSGSGGSSLDTKKEYFDRIKNRFENCLHATQDYIIKLTQEEKAASGGFDYIIFSWSKIIPKDIDKRIQKLKKSQE